MHGTTCRYIAFAHYFTVHMPASVLISTNDDKRSHTRNYSFSIAATLAVWLIKNIVLSRIRTLMWPKCASFQKSAFFLLEPINFHTIFQVILISIRILNLYRHDWFCDFFLLVPIFFFFMQFMFCLTLLIFVHYSSTVSCHVTWPNVDSCFATLRAPLLPASLSLSVVLALPLITDRVPLQLKLWEKSIHLIEFSQVLPGRVRKVNKNLFFPLSWSSFKTHWNWAFEHRNEIYFCSL